MLLKTKEGKNIRYEYKRTVKAEWWEILTQGYGRDLKIYCREHVISINNKNVKLIEWFN